LFPKKGDRQWSPFFFEPADFSTEDNPANRNVRP
jgi:hypothetical protein